MTGKATWISLPRAVVVGHDTLSRTVEAVDDVGLTGRPLLVTSPTPNSVAGERVLADFEAAGADPAVVVIESATFGAVERVVQAVGDADADYLVGIGGGKAIDVAKMAGSRTDLEFVSVPTAASHDGIVSGRGSIPEGDARHSVAAAPPVVVIADTMVLADAPWELTTAGCADIISNYTAVKDWQLAQRLRNVEYSHYAATLSEMTA
ncbi:MAG: iron-containing alcohol dehydrogenase, partial [Halobacteriales archaeon]|nr:iron-containing alcohol dehydrogenase [Halobacteriales archaeon]